MQKETAWDMQEQIRNWESKFIAEPSINLEDRQELKSHLLDMIDDLKDLGLEEDEAFFVASKRLGNPNALKTDYEEVNRTFIHIQKSLFLLAGVLAYYLLFFFTKGSAKLLFIALVNTQGSTQTALVWLFRYLILAHVLFIVFTASIFFLERQTLRFIGKIALTPKKTFCLMLLAIALSLADTCLYAIAKSAMGLNYPLRGHFYDAFLYFDYSFPALICASFVILYFKYYLKTNF